MSGDHCHHNLDGSGLFDESEGELTSFAPRWGALEKNPFYKIVQRFKSKEFLGGNRPNQKIEFAMLFIELNRTFSEKGDLRKKLDEVCLNLKEQPLTFFGEQRGTYFHCLDEIRLCWQEVWFTDFRDYIYSLPEWHNRSNITKAARYSDAEIILAFHQYEQKSTASPTKASTPSFFNYFCSFFSTPKANSVDNGGSNVGARVVRASVSFSELS